MYKNMQSTLHTDDFNVLSGLTTITPTVVVLILYLCFGTHPWGVADRPAQHSTVPEREQHFLSQRMQSMRRQWLKRRPLHAGTLWKFSWKQIRETWQRSHYIAKRSQGPLHFLQQSPKSCILAAGVGMERGCGLVRATITSQCRVTLPQKPCFTVPN